MRAVLLGDPHAIPILASLDHEDLRAAAAEAVEPAVVERASVVRVLGGLRDRTWPPERVQAWASFVRRGYISNRNEHPLRPLRIDYDDAYEDEISTVVARLDEIGDLVDGEVSSGEILDLLQLLGESWPTR
ncbi:MAG: hypothetical protein GY750_14150 [Lentisphaerae bacterium]|nr:hypothetical protein [Lentisphaerota bacterium]